MLNKVEVTTAQGLTLSLPLEDYQDGYLITEVEGLDPVKATIVSSSFANLDGEQYQSARREARNVVIHLDLIAGLGPTITELRRKLYWIFMPKTTVRLRFFQDDEPAVDIYGVIETFVAPLFEQEPTATISIICHKPEFYDPIPVVFNGLTTSNIDDEFVYDYAGTIETGFTIDFAIDRDVSEFVIFHRGDDNTSSSLEFYSPLVAGDTLSISTVSRAKGATLIRSGSDSSILYGIPGYSNWINLLPGKNYLRVYTEGAPIPYTIEYTTKYGGL